MRPSFKRILLPAVAISLASAVLFFHSQLLDTVKRESTVLQETNFVPSPHGIKMISLGFDQILADCYWLQFISYVGDTENRKKDHFALADNYLDLITGLDPYFVSAYWFAAFTVGTEMKRPQTAAEIIQRGVNANQNNWYLPLIAGINQYLNAKNEIAAAKYYRQAARYPDSPIWLHRQAQILESRIPSTIKEINTWTNVFEAESDSRVKDIARQKLIDLWGTIIATRPPKNIRDKAVLALKDLGVDVDFYLKQFENKGK